MNREQIEALAVGDVIERDLIGNGNWKPVTVTDITYRGVSVQGKAYVGVYTTFGSAQMSGSIREGESRYFRMPGNG